MDAAAANLIAEAWELFGGHEPDTSPAGTVRQAALERAITQLGVTESPPGSNRVKYSDWYGMTGPWCAMFVTWCFVLAAADAGQGSPTFVRGSRYAYVPYLLADARAGRYRLQLVGDPVAGDLAVYNWDGGDPDHTGIFEAWTGGRTFTAIEGNTAVGNDSNGGAVLRRTRDAADTHVDFVRVAEP
jgi:hypothetical protein